MSKEKEIIINGIDVSECEFFQEDGGENTCRAEEDYTGTVVCCSACDNCYYKQLKRLQEENKELKKRQITKNGFICDCEQNAKYKQALEEIREQYVNKAFFKCDKTEEECPCHNCIILGQLDRVQNIVKIIDEVLNDRD